MGKGGEFGMEVLAELQRRFYETYPRHPDSEQYKYQTSSTFKPTQVKCPPGGLNQIPPSMTISGDIRLTPFYDTKEVMDNVERWVADINAAVEARCAIFTKTHDACSLSLFLTQYFFLCCSFLLK